MFSLKAPTNTAQQGMWHLGAVCVEHGHTDGQGHENIPPYIKANRNCPRMHLVLLSTDLELKCGQATPKRGVSGYYLTFRDS